MANALYSGGKEGLLDGSFNWAGSTLRCALVDSGYTPNLVTDRFLSDIPAAQVAATSPVMGAKTQTAGTARAGNVVFFNITGGPFYYIVIYVDFGTPSIDRLFACIDTAQGLPLAAMSNGNATIIWDVGPNGIFTL